MDDSLRMPYGKYKGVRIGLIPGPLLRAELEFSIELKKRKYDALRALMQQKVDEYDRERED